MLPEDCLSVILSFTSPEDALISSLVSSTFRSATNSDMVWERFLPPDYPEIVSSSVKPLEFRSKKELFQCLCDSVLIDGGNKIVKLEKSTGKKCYILSAQQLSITWSSNPLFSRVAVLRITDWLEVRGNVRTQTLSPNTSYGVYLVMQVSERAYGLDLMPLEMRLEVGNQVYCRSVFLEGKKQMSEREDGWMEIEFGYFFSGDKDEVVKMSLMEVKGCHLKGGLVIEGIEFRPKRQLK
ncbi:Tetratricopeptide repeat-like superfamily protein [Hibiscus syriacus]|uniref:Tetratricopeptide repeat-like superfamily protein n=1 Tax=Hibiscus syriacus TaxID=106335 RepID=A0A6A2XRB4_HIBSY|nr:Tetratricopeptide repeat-like superfamily protein [Hibiscus syriacus]